MQNPIDLEAEYNNRARVPDHMVVMQGWQRDAAAWREACPKAELNLAYGPGEREKLDLFWPDAGAEAPIAMFIHGGYWQALGREWCSHLARGLNAHGVAVAVPSYDLCPTVPLATIVTQMQAATAMLYATHWPALDAALPADLVPAALPVSGVFELEPLRYTSIGTGLRLDAAEALRLSPRYLPRPPGIIHCVVGGAESDEFLRQNRDMAEAWGGTAETLPGLNHFTVLAPFADPDSAVVARAKTLAFG